MSFYTFDADEGVMAHAPIAALILLCDLISVLIAAQVRRLENLRCNSREARKLALGPRWGPLRVYVKRQSKRGCG
jgi:hypothetical protein